MIIRSLPARRQIDAGDDTLLDAASGHRQDGWPARRVLIRHPWVRAADGPGAADTADASPLIVPEDGAANGRRAA